MKISHLIYIISVSAALLPQTLSAQSEAWLDSIEHNNTTLATQRRQLEASYAESRSEARLSDPEAEVGYFFGSPKGIPNRVNVSVSQSLDWAVITGRKRKLTRAADRMADATYAAQRLTILSEAEQLLTQAVYLNKLCGELQSRCQQADALAAAYERKFNEGDINRLEVNKVKLNASVALAALQKAETERNGVMLNLQKLNGGKPVNCTDTTYAAHSLPALPDVLQHTGEQHPEVLARKASLAQSIEQLRVSKSEAWPTLSVGFSGEYVKDSRYSGVTLGVSIPLWGNSRAKVKQRKMENRVSELDLTDVQTQLTADIRTQYAAAQKLFATAHRLEEQIASTANAELLNRALAEGQISVMDYLLETAFYYDARTAQLEAERDAQLASAALRSYMR